MRIVLDTTILVRANERSDGLARQLLKRIVESEHRVTLRPRARVDLLEQFAWYGEEPGVELAERYLTAVEGTCSLLATQPLMGVLYESGIEELSEMRRFRVKGFDSHLIF